MVRHSLVISNGKAKLYPRACADIWRENTTPSWGNWELEPCGHQEFQGLKRWLQFPLQTPGPSCVVCLRWLLLRAVAVSFLGTVFEQAALFILQLLQLKSHNCREDAREKHEHCRDNTRLSCLIPHLSNAFCIFCSGAWAHLAPPFPWEEISSWLITLLLITCLSVWGCTWITTLSTRRLLLFRILGRLHHWFFAINTF